jgi:hypothetical protein
MIRIGDEEGAMLGILEPIGHVIVCGRELGRSLLRAAWGKIGHRVMAAQCDPLAAGGGGISRESPSYLSHDTEHGKADEHGTAGYIGQELLLKKRLSTKESIAEYKPEHGRIRI